MLPVLLTKQWKVNPALSELQMFCDRADNQDRSQLQRLGLKSSERLGVLTICCLKFWSLFETQLTFEQTWDELWLCRA